MKEISSKKTHRAAASGPEWEHIKKNIDSILLSTKNSADDIKRVCQSLDGMTAEERRKTIQETFGTPCYHKVRPLLEKLDRIESSRT